VPFGPARVVVNTREKIFRMIREEITKRIKNPSAFKHNSDYLQFILSNIPEGHRGIPCHITSMLFAGHTNLAATFAWGVVELMYNRNLYKRAVAEADSVRLEDEKGSSHLGVLSAVPFLSSCIDEVTRLYGITLVFRKTKRPVKFEKYVIPSGRLVCFNPQLTHHDETVYPEPLSFNPDRWGRSSSSSSSSSSTSEAAAYAAKSLGWGAGKHKCLGESYARSILIGCWLQLLRSANISLVNPDARKTTPDYEKSLGTAFAKDPVLLQFKPR